MVVYSTSERLVALPEHAKSDQARQPENPPTRLLGSFRSHKSNLRADWPCESRDDGFAVSLERGHLGIVLQVDRKLVDAE